MIQTDKKFREDILKTMFLQGSLLKNRAFVHEARVEDDTIQEGIDFAASVYNEADVNVGEGTYSLTTTSEVITFKDGISVYGGCLDGDLDDCNAALRSSYIYDNSYSGGTLGNPDRAVQGTSYIAEDTVVDGFTVRGASSSTNNQNAYTSAVYLSGNVSAGYASPTIQNCIITGSAGDLGNRDDFSYGIYINGGSPTIQDCTITGATGNTGDNNDYAYGLYLTGSPSAVIQRNEIVSGTGVGTENTLGIYNSSSNPTIRNNTIDGGNGTSSCYGIRNDSSSPTIQNNTIDGGSGDGFIAGIYLQATSNPVIENNIIFVTASSGSRYGIYELALESDPDRVRNNDIFDCPTALYRDHDQLSEQDLDAVSGGKFGYWDSGTFYSAILPSDLDHTGNTGDTAVLDPATWEFTGSSPVSVTDGGLNLYSDFTTDKDGNPGPSAGSWSMGAYRK